VLVPRCTRKLLARIGPPVVEPPASTTTLGDWFASQVAVSHKRFILLISEHSRLPVVMPARDARHPPRNFPDAGAVAIGSGGTCPCFPNQRINADRARREVFPGCSRARSARRSVLTFGA